MERARWFSSNSVQRIAVNGNNLITINSNTALSIIDTTSSSISVYDSSNQLTTSGLTDVVTYGDIAYIATLDIGLAFRHGKRNLPCAVGLNRHK